MNGDHVFNSKGTQAPKDRVTEKEKLQTISVGVFSFFCALQLASILMATAFLVFNIIYADHRCVKATPRKYVFDVTYLTFVSVRRHGILDGSRDRISSRVQAPFPLCTSYVAINALN